MKLFKNGLIGLLLLVVILLGISSFLTKQYLQILPAILVLAMFFPSVNILLKEKIPNYTSQAQILFIIFLLVCYFAAGKLYMRDSIFRNAADEQIISQMYDEFLNDWPADTQSKTINNTYGRIQVLISGPDTAPPLILLHAENMSSISWKENIHTLSQKYRCYAIDHIGEVGKSQLTDLTKFPRSEKEVTSLYIEVADSLHLKKFTVIGAGTGARSALLLAINTPARVNKLVLIGPMGINKPDPGFLWRTIGSSMFPFPSLSQSISEWVIGTNNPAAAQYENWYRTVISTSVPHTSYPMAITSEQLAKIEIPTLLILGTNDHLTGPPDQVTEKAKPLKNLQTEVLPASHLVAIEKAEEINQLIDNFLN